VATRGGIGVTPTTRALDARLATCTSTISTRSRGTPTTVNNIRSARLNGGRRGRGDHLATAAATRSVSECAYTTPALLLVLLLAVRSTRRCRGGKVSRCLSVGWWVCERGHAGVRVCVLCGYLNITPHKTGKRRPANKHIQIFTHIYALTLTHSLTHSLTYTLTHTQVYTRWTERERERERTYAERDGGGGVPFTKFMMNEDLPVPREPSTSYSVSATENAKGEHTRKHRGTTRSITRTPTTLYEETAAVMVVEQRTKNNTHTHTHTAKITPLNTLLFLLFSAQLLYVVWLVYVSLLSIRSRSTTASQRARTPK
jgi:hypothetical protein